MSNPVVLNHMLWLTNVDCFPERHYPHCVVHCTELLSRDGMSDCGTDGVALMALSARGV